MTASVDPVDKAREKAEKSGVKFPVGLGLSARDFSEATGAFYDAEKGFLHAAGFILRPDGRIASAVYSTGAIGRLTASDCLAWVGFMMGKG